MTSVDLLGYCVVDPVTNAKSIVVSRKALDEEKENTRSSLLFGLLLHEIGHCYFGRAHDDVAVTKKGH